MTYAEEQANRSEAFKKAIALVRSDNQPADIVARLEALQKDINPVEENDFIDLYEAVRVARG